MTRVERNKGKYGEKVIKNKKDKKDKRIEQIEEEGLIETLIIWSFKATYKTIKWTFKISYKIIVNIMKGLYKTIKWVNKVVSKAFMKSNKYVKTATIYMLVGFAVFGLYTLYNGKEEIVVKDVFQVNFTETDSVILKEENEKLKKELELVKSQLQKEKTIESLNSVEKDIYDKGIEKGLTHEQSILAVSISKHETGKWTSKAFKNYNNFGGIMGSKGLKDYGTYEEGIESFVELLKNRYFDEGLNTIEKIGNKYCPIGASNDPAGLNKYWIPSVTKNYNNYLSR